MDAQDMARRETQEPAAAPAAEVFPTYHQRIAVPFDYPVHFTRRLFHLDNPLFASTLDRFGEGRRHRALVYIDAGVVAAHPALAARIKEYFHSRPDDLELAAPLQVVRGGEEAKRSWDLVRDAMWTIGNLHLDRQSYVVAIGGGAVLDMVGFAASLVHRGLRLVRVPTTTLAQGDAGIGVKNGMDEHGQKNYVGTFAPPAAVMNDFDFLPTLPFEHWIGGVAEAFKVAIIKDAPFFEFLRRSAAALRGRDAAAMGEAVHRSAVLHLDHIRGGGDPFETGSARPLDFGHWAAHRVESLSGYTLGHGQAVAVGIALDSTYARAQGLIDGGELEEILGGLAACGLPTYSPLLDERKDGELLVLEGLRHFREHLGGRLAITLPRGIGGRIDVHEMDHRAIAGAIESLRGR
jgi:3-dehydroquinate synthase